jgi:prolyl-tRNA editing enzyme YbaK/EbsC (Cys-tRNA(Pro) deacylase)
MSIELVKAYFRGTEMEEKVHELETSSATVELAAQALGCEPAHIAKTLSFAIEERTLLIVATGDAKVDNKKYKERFGAKAKMLPGDQVEGRVGHAPGGVCPFGIKEGVEVYLDESLRRFQVVYPAAGSENSMVVMTLPELEQWSHALAWVDVCKGWREEPAE